MVAANNVNLLAQNLSMLPLFLRTRTSQPLSFLPGSFGSFVIFLFNFISLWLITIWLIFSLCARLLVTLAENCVISCQFSALTLIDFNTIEYKLKIIMDAILLPADIQSIQLSIGIQCYWIIFLCSAIFLAGNFGSFLLSYPCINY